MRRVGRAGWKLAPLLVLATLNALVAKIPPLSTGAFTYAVIPDTQSYDGEGRHTKCGRAPSVGLTRNEKLESCVLTCGFTADDIANVRKLMLD